MAKQYTRKRQVSRGIIFKQWSLLIIVFVLGYATASVYRFSTLKSEWIGYFFDKQPLTIVNPRQHVELPPPKFEFYTLLAHEKGRHVVATAPATTPVQQTHVEPLATNSHVQSAPVTNVPVVAAHSETSGSSKDNYLVQVASFRRLNEAARLKSSLSMKGFDVSINSALQGGVQWYRVVMGPFSSKLQAEQAQHLFAKREHTIGMIRRMDA